MRATVNAAHVMDRVTHCPRFRLPDQRSFQCSVCRGVDQLGEDVRLAVAALEAINDDHVTAESGSGNSDPPFFTGGVGEEHRADAVDPVCPSLAAQFR